MTSLERLKLEALSQEYVHLQNMLEDDNMKEIIIVLKIGSYYLVRL